jgi:hypothetical protein
MKLSGFASAWGRRAFVMATLGGLVAAGPRIAFAQAPAAPAPAAPAAPAEQAPPPKDEFQFSSDAAIVLWTIKPEATNDFELVWKTVKGKLAASDKPEMKALGDSMQIFKVEMVPGAAPGPVTYMFVMAPVVKGATYHPIKILYESGIFPREEAQPLFEKLSGAYTGINPLSLVKVQ